MKHSLSCVQETKLRDAHHLATLNFNHSSRFKHRLFVNDTNANSPVPSTTRSGGVITVIRSDFPGFDSARELRELSVPGRYLVVRLVVNQAPLYVHNVYAPVDDHEKSIFFDHLPSDDFEDNSTHIVLGDLNTPLEPLIDSSDCRTSLHSGHSACLRWLGILGVVDAWRVHHPDARVFTGPQPRKNRLDYILLSNDFCGAVYGDSTYFEPKGAGDHLAHRVVLRTMAQPQGHGYWRFPQGLLEYPDVVEAIKNEAAAVLSNLRRAANPGKVWMEWKVSTRRMLQQVQRKLKQQQERAIVEARSVLTRAAAQYRVDRDPQSQVAFQSALSAYKDCVETSRAYNQDTAFDFQAMQTEKSTKFFFRPLDTSLRRVSIEEVQLSDGTRSNNPADISEAFRSHWGAIMGSGVDQANDDTRQVAQQRLLSSIERCLSQDEQDILNSPITADDLATAIKKMRPGSAPGMDGLPASFYQLAPDIFGQCLEIVFNYQLSRGELLPCQRKSAVSLLHKKGCRAAPGNYRPIALMGVDVKALSKALAFRLQSLLPKLIHLDQKAFVKGRSLHHQVRFMADLQSLVTARDDEAYALFLDFEKAYDRVDWDYMVHVLDRMGCGGAFANWVKLLYTKPLAHLILNGHIQAALEPTRGVKQGDPLSALLFLMVIEPLGNLLRRHEEHGVCLSDDYTVTSAFFADDSTLLSGSAAGVQAQLELVEVYCCGSGASLNKSKCVLMSLNRHRSAHPIEGVRTLDPGGTVTYLGLPFGQQMTDATILESLDNRFYEGFQSWFRRARTLQGRLLVAQTMILSRLWHYTAHAPVPPSVTKKWQAMLHRFVLSRRYERAARHVQFLPNEYVLARKAEGGLNVPRIDCLIKRQRLQLVLQFVGASALPERNWTTPGQLLLQWVQPAWGPTRALDLLTYSPTRHGDMIHRHSLSPWWRDAWKLWYSVKWPVTWQSLQSSDKVKHALHQPIWFNGERTFQFEATPRRIRTSGSIQRRSLAMVAEPQRSFRRHIAEVFQLRSLADFTQGFDHWPSRDEFAQRFVDYTMVSTPVYKQLRWLKRLHSEATQVLRRIVEPAEVTTDHLRTYPASPLMTGVQGQERTHWVPRIPKSQLLRLVQPSIEPVRVHPFKLHDPYSDDVKDYVRRRKRLRRLLLPIYEDLQFRLAYRLLPVRSRFSFMSTTSPDIVYCVRDGCQSVETERHLFFECKLAAELWRTLLSDWAVFFATTPSWAEIVLAREPVRVHPFKLHDPYSDDVKDYVRRRKRLRRLLLPIYEDLQFRLAYRLLPVRSRFSFMSTTSPDIVYCVRDGCQSVETERHLFFECKLAAELWRTLLSDWAVFFATTPSWAEIVLARDPGVREVWKTHEQEVWDVWHAVRAVTLHLLWSERNSRLFNQRDPMPPIPALRVIYTTVSAHIRAWIRRVFDDIEKEALQDVLQGLRETRSMGSFIRASPELFQVRFL